MNLHQRSRRRIVAVAGATALILAGGSAAFAYFTTGGGTGAGTASTGSAGSVTVAVNNDVNGDLAPAALGDAHAIIDTVTYTLTNAANADNHVNLVTISIPAAFGPISGGHPACTANNFSINGQPVANTVAGAATPVTQAINVTLAPVGGGAPSDQFSGSFTLQLVENGANQDSCQGLANVPLTVVAS